jgi:hypothetical protein
MIMKVESIEDLNDGSCRVTFAMDWDTMAIFARIGLENTLIKAAEESIQTFDMTTEGMAENEHS